MPSLLQFIPFSDEMRTKQFATWFGGEIPASARYGRNPTADQVVSAFNRAAPAGLSIKQEVSGKSWTLVVSGPGGESLRIDAKQRGADKENVLFTVSGDRAVLEAIVAHLPASCGSFLISADGTNPAIFTAGSG